MLASPDPRIVNTRGCGPLMKYWYRRGFWENIFMGLFGIFIGVYMIFVFQRNHQEFLQLRDESDDRKRILYAHSMSSLRSMASSHLNKNAQARYQYSGMNESPSIGTTVAYESDNNSSTAFYQPRAKFNVNA